MFFIQNYNSSFNSIKLILPCGPQTSNNLLINFLVESYNFLNYKDFFEEFSKVTSVFASYNLLVRVILFLSPTIPGSKSVFSFFIKSFNSSFFVKNFLLKDFALSYNQRKQQVIEVTINYIILLKICIILVYLNFSSIIFKNNILNLNFFKQFIKSFINFLFSFQFHFFLIEKNLVFFEKKFVNYIFPSFSIKDNIFLS